MKNTFILGLILLSQIGFSQVKEMNPSSTMLIDLSAAGEKEFNKNYEACDKVWEKMANGLSEEDLTQQDKDILSKCDETMDSYWSILEGGCSWYCGGGPREVTASSYLKSQGKNSYDPDNAHDLSYETAWVEGVPGYGIGEYLLYTFDGASPRVTDIKVVNGYVKSKSAWENNSRVKKLKLYIDNVPFAILNLKDIRGVQSFKFEPIGKEWKIGDKLPDMQLKFEILEVYKGLKYDDVAITEIYFDGIEVHCFAKGTQIQLPDNTTKNIEDLKIGDSVAYLDMETHELKSAKIEKLESVVHHGLVTYTFESGLEITATQDHPFKIQNKGWASLKPERSEYYKSFENIQKIDLGDVFVKSNGTDKLISIEYLEGHQKTYTISKLSSGDNFIANGLVVGVEELRFESNTVAQN